MVDDKQNLMRLKPTRAIILFAAAVLSFIFTISYSAFFDNFKVLGLLYAIPVLLVVVVMQDFGIRIGKGEVSFFNELTPQQLSVTNITILLSTIIILVIAFLVRSVGDPPRMNFFWYLAFLALSYLVTWIFPFARSLYKMIEESDTKK